MAGDIPWSDLIVAACLVAGGFFLFVAGLGILRLPDVLIRMHASTDFLDIAVALALVAFLATIAFAWYAERTTEQLNRDRRASERVEEPDGR
jgi:multisubunit Na+/H+ antiporter MnhG subunit